MKRTTQWQGRLMLATIAAITLAVSSCSPASTEGDPTEPAASDINREATLTFATASPIAGLDPVYYISSGQHAQMSFIYDSLTQLAPDGSTAPMLAETWEFSDDGSVLTFHLRQDVTFNDGTPFDAEAVRVNLERGLNDPKSNVAGALSDIVDIDVVDEATIDLKLAPGRGAGLPAALTTFPGMMLSPKALAERADEIAMDPGEAGSGAYLVTGLTPGESVTLERTDDYWDHDAAYVKTVEISTMADNTARLNGVQTGVLDITQITAPTAIQQAEGLMEAGTLEGEFIDMDITQTMFINSKSGPLADLRARQAVAAAINKEAIVDGLFGGRAVPATQLYPSTWAHDSSLVDGTAQKYNPDAAKALVEELGGLSFTLTFGAGFATEPVAQVIQAQLDEVGIEVELAPLQYPSNEEAFANGTADAILSTTTTAADPSGTLALWATAGIEGASSFMDEVASIGEQALNPTLSQADRAELYFAIWRLMDEQVGWIPVVAPQQLWVRNDHVAPVADSTSWIRAGVPTFRNLVILTSN